MESYFLDTNVLIDYAAQREPYYQESKLIFRLAENGKIELGVSAISFPTLYYLCNKMYLPDKLAILSSEIRKVSTVITVSEEVIVSAEKSNFKDLEDAMQNHLAESNGYHTIITNNKKDFKKSNLAILTPKEFLATL